MHDLCHLVVAVVLTIILFNYQRHTYYHQYIFYLEDDAFKIHFWVQPPTLISADKRKIKLDREKLLGDVACLGNLDDHNKPKACVMCKTGQVPLQRVHRSHMSKSLYVLELLINGKQMLIIKKNCSMMVLLQHTCQVVV